MSFKHKPRNNRTNNKYNNNRTNNRYNNKRTNNRYNNKRNSQKYTVKFSNLPSDMDRDELRELLTEWHPIGRVCVNKYYNNTIAYVDFYKKLQAEKAVFQLDKTPFDGLIIEVTPVKPKPRY